MKGIVGLVLAGERSERMGRDKAFVCFEGAPLVARALARLRPRVEAVAISANGDPARFAPFGCPVLADRDATRPGPLAGVAAGLAFAATRGADYLATVPCDAPFAPVDLVERLALAADARHPAAAASARGVEPLFALWPIACLGRVETALASGDGSVQRLLARLDVRAVAIPVEPGAEWHLNLNTPDDLSRLAGGA